MKKILIASLVFVSLSAATQAQVTTAANDVTPATKNQGQADKDAAKVKKEAALTAAFAKAGLTAEEQMKARAVLDDANVKTKPIKADASLSDADKKEKLDAIYAERNEQLKNVLGDEKYKAFKAAQKAQKEAANAAQ